MSGAVEVELFRGVPGPSPWYLTIDTPATASFTWQAPGDESRHPGKTLLVGRRGVVAILSWQNYAMPLDDCRLLIWNQKSTNTAPTSPVRLIVIEPDKLNPFSQDFNALCRKMDQDNTSILTEGGTSGEVSLSTEIVDENLHADFPEPLRAIEELPMWCRSSGIALPDWDQRFGYALLVARPSESKFRLYPQDWFNHGGFDYMYQWPTRVVRNAQTGRIHGEGVRIPPFVLSDSLRELRRA